MALQRQASGTLHVGLPVSPSGDHEVLSNPRPSIGHSRMFDAARSDRGGLRTSVLTKPSRLSKGKRTPHSWRVPCSVGCVLAVCSFALVATIFGSQFLMGGRSSARMDDAFGKSDGQQWIRSGSEEDVGKLEVNLKGVERSGGDKTGIDGSVWFGDGGVNTGVDGDQSSSSQDVQKKLQSGSLYNERGRDELVEIGARYEDRHVNNGEKEDTVVEDRSKEVSISGKVDLDEYDDDGGDVDVEKKAEAVDSNDDARRTQKLSGAGGSVQTDAGTVEGVVVFDKSAEQDSRSTPEVLSNQDTVSGDAKAQKSPRSKKRRHAATPPCDIDFLRSTEGLEEPVSDGAFVNISLSYVQSEPRPFGNPSWVPKFGGHQSLVEREISFHADDQSLHCGFVKAPSGEPWTGFELSEGDQEYLSTCHIAVSSCIFGAWDNLRTPTNKKMTSSSKAKVCFVMFVDQKSLDVILEEGQKPNDKGVLGLWKIVLIKNLPYLDGRRNGKVPKLLTHRLFPNARYSIWLDSKLRLHADPLLILEHFLWRGNHEYAISNHYDRHCVWEEVAQNKRLNKFNHTIIDDQFQFYQREGLPRFNKSDPNRYLPSHVPEGSFIVRAHTPMSNLFSCLWFNEVERFTPRDQLSFAATYIKLARMNPAKQFRFNMFKDCERKAMAKLYHHRLDAGSAVTHI